MIISPQKSRIKVISHEESDGRLKEIYDDLIKSREMTLDPGEATDNDLTTPLKEKEHSDETILDVFSGLLFQLCQSNGTRPRCSPRKSRRSRL